jgi:hypothetical protein
MRSVVATAIQGIGVGEFVGKFEFKQAAIANQSECAADRVCAVAKSEEEEFISRIVGGHEKAIGIEDFLPDAPPEGPATKAVEASGTDALVIEQQLPDCCGVRCRNAACNLGYVAGAHFAAVHLIRAVPGAITANYNALHRALLRDGERAADFVADGKFMGGGSPLQAYVKRAEYSVNCHDQRPEERRANEFKEKVKKERKESQREEKRKEKEEKKHKKDDEKKPQSTGQSD